ncbi:MAG: glycosyltransferase [Cyanobacteriota bacterium]
MVTRVSVVLPFRNAAPWLPACLASLDAQTETAWELVAIDDGSSDASASLVADWAAGRPQPLRLLRQPGRGVAAARNAGWAAATAPLVAFLDADDLALPGRLERQAARFEADPQLQHLLCGWRRLDASGAPLHDVQPWQEGAGFTLESAFEHKAVLPSAWMLRRSLLTRLGGFDPALRHAEDVDLLLRLAAAGCPGAWLEEVLCGYRVHGGGASRHAADQAHALLWVVNHRLDDLPPGHPLRARRASLLHGTRAWAGWQAWHEGQQDLALELWRTAWGSRPHGDAFTWLHLAENVARSCARIGEPCVPEQLLQHPTWRALEQHVLLDFAQRPGRSGRPGRSDRRLESLAGRLRSDLAAASPLWQPAALARWWQQLPAGADPLAELRLRVLAWCEALLGGERTEPLPTQPLAAELGELLRQWALICWPEHPEAARQRLQEAFELQPTAELARAIARLAAPRYACGAAALEQLAAQLPPCPTDPADAARFAPLPLPPAAEACRGPDCAPCALGHLAALGWRREALAPGLEQWQPPLPVTTTGAATASRGWSETPFRLEELPHGRVWLRPPLSNPWGTSHGLAVVDGEGQLQTHLCRRYPLAWPGCPTPPASVEPPPPQPPLAVAGTVLALADLSAEIHYHWLLESLPRLGLALASQGGIWPDSWLLWHNGGSSERVRRCLVDDLGIPPERLIDAHRHPHLTAERLLLPSPLPRFGWPSRRARAWLRHRYLTPAQRRPRRGPGRRLWLARGASGRRPVFGEAELLAHLEQQGLGLEPTVLDGLTLAEQAARIAAAELLVLPHGAALAGLAFARPGTRVLELHQPRYAPPYGHALVAAGGLALYRCEQPASPPGLYRQLLFEAPITEPILLDAPRIATALHHIAVEAPPA